MRQSSYALSLGKHLLDLEDYSVYFIKDETKLYFVMDMTMTQSDDIIREIFTIVFKR